MAGKTPPCKIALMKRTVYLDYAASAPLRPEAARAMAASGQNYFGNASSVHSVGQQALNAIDASAATIAQIFNCRADELIFVSGGTEADNLAIKGVAKRSARGHIITSAIEHKAVLASCEALAKEGFDITYIKPDASGVINPHKVREAVREHTVLVSIMYVNNETGIVQPISEIGAVLAEINNGRQNKVLLHTDAVQAGLLDLNVQTLGVDLMTISAHKLGGPKGVGCLFARSGINLVPQIDGGGQQRGVRSGTLNTAGIAGLTAALTASQKNREKEVARLGILQRRLTEGLKKLPGIEMNGDMHYRTPSILNFSIAGQTSEALVIGCDLEGVAISAASACSAGSIQPSYVLHAMGLSDERAQSSLRVSLGYRTKIGEIDTLLRVLTKLSQSR